MGFPVDRLTTNVLGSIEVDVASVRVFRADPTRRGVVLLFVSIGEGMKKMTSGGSSG